MRIRNTVFFVALFVAAMMVRAMLKRPPASLGRKRIPAPTSGSDHVPVTPQRASAPEAPGAGGRHHHLTSIRTVPPAMPAEGE